MSNPVRSLSFAWAPKSSARLHSMLGRFTQLLVGVLSLVLLAALYLTNSDWFYTKPGWLDAWYYVGYGLYYDNPLFLVAVTADEGKADQLARRLATEGVQLRFDGRLVPARGHRLVPFFVFRTR
jgi:hypothetical protein